MYMKYQDRFDKLEELSNPTMGRFMLTQVLTRMASTCKECQRDRMRCTIKPLCPDRVFLNMLIALGAKTSELPSFCYQVSIRALEAYLKSGAKRDHPHEPRYPLSYFRRYVQFKKDDDEANFEVFKKWLETTTKQTVFGYAIENRWYFGVGKGIFSVDLKRSMVSLDPDGDIVRREALEPLLTFLMKLYDLSADILKDMQDTWYLRIDFPEFSEEAYSEQVEPQLNALREYWSFVRVNNFNSNTQFLIGLDPPPERAMRLDGLRKTAIILAEIAEAAPKKASRKRSATPVEAPAQSTG
ncbi:MAG: hypothetical protein ACFE9D_00790 [Promethearchaeota archaeon]